jgi:hypothetical protein
MTVALYEEKAVSDARECVADLQVPRRIDGTPLGGDLRPGRFLAYSPAKSRQRSARRISHKDAPPACGDGEGRLTG